jgi:hypothetical protein
MYDYLFNITFISIVAAFVYSNSWFFNGLGIFSTNKS